MGMMEVGKDILPGDMAALLEWIEERVAKRSKEPMDCVWLPLVAAEFTIMLARKNWNYDESVDEAIDSIRLKAREFAQSIYKKASDGGK
jgi:hypothetical protein